VSAVKDVVYCILWQTFTPQLSSDSFSPTYEKLSFKSIYNVCFNSWKTDSVEKVWPVFFSFFCLYCAYINKLKQLKQLKSLTAFCGSRVSTVKWYHFRRWYVCFYVLCRVLLRIINCVLKRSDKEKIMTKQRWDVVKFDESIHQAEWLSGWPFCLQKTRHKLRQGSGDFAASRSN